MPQNQQIKLGTATDKAGSLLTVYKSEQLGMSPAYSFFLKHYAELIDAGLSFPITTWNDQCEILYVTEDEHVVGQITFDLKNPTAPGALWIVLSSIKESHRGRGIYKIMHRYIDQLAEQYGCHGVCSFVHVKNENQLRALESVGKKPVFYFVGKKI